MAKAEQNNVDLRIEDMIGFKCIAKNQIAFGYKHPSIFFIRTFENVFLNKKRDNKMASKELRKHCFYSSFQKQN